MPGVVALDHANSANDRHDIIVRFALTAQTPEEQVERLAGIVRRPVVRR
jgi:hypothetical protein